MKDADKSKEELLAELFTLREQVAELQCDARKQANSSLS